MTQDSPALAATPSADATAQPSADTAAAAHPCPRCDVDRGSETRILCSACWRDAPVALRKRWVGALLALQRRHPAVLSIHAWARPGAPRPERGPRPAKPKARPKPCGLCNIPTPEPSRRELAAQLLNILPLGRPVQVRERAEFVARRLSGLCAECAAAPPIRSAAP